MKRFRLLNGTAKSVFEMAVDGEVVETAAGPLGAIESEAAEHHPSVERARLVAFTDLGKKILQGYGRPHREGDGPRHPELEQAIFADPDNPDAWAVYGDWLSVQGDPRGEIIALQLARDKDGDRPSGPGFEGEINDLLIQRLDWLRDEAVAAIYGDQDVCDVEWRYGFLWSAYFRPDRASFGLLDRAFGALLQSSASRFLYEIILSGMKSRREFDALHARGVMPSVRRLRILHTSDTDPPLTPRSNNPFLAELNEHYPNLELLTLEGRKVDLPRLSHDNLKTLVLLTGALPKRTRFGALPALQRLHASFAETGYGGGRLALPDNVMDAVGLANVKHIGFDGHPNLATQLISRLAGSALLAQASSLSLNIAMIGEEAVDLILANADAFRHLKVIRLPHVAHSRGIYQRLYEALGSAVIAPPGFTFRLPSVRVRGF